MPTALARSSHGRSSTLGRERFAEAFAGDLPSEQVRFMADAQLPWGMEALTGAVTEPGWRSKPSWYLVSTEDRMIPAPAQRAMAERIGRAGGRAPI
ncbi:hypothetical protein K7B10_29045, partial [Streptomyces flavotricini]|nr:hypothetical protein [Streptomyces flavotricini]